jgi:hypothetical protein
MALIAARKILASPAVNEPASDSHTLRRKLSRLTSGFLSARMPQAYQILITEARLLFVDYGHRFSKSTGSLTSVTLKCFASAGYFRATASYIA